MGEIQRQESLRVAESRLQCHAPLYQVQIYLAEQMKKVAGSADLSWYILFLPSR